MANGTILEVQVIFLSPLFQQMHRVQFFHTKHAILLSYYYHNSEAQSS
jgi:hypothetical protein